MNKIFQTICVLVLMTFSCFGSIIDYTTIGGGSSTFTGSYSNLTGLPYTITLTNSDGTIILTSVVTNVTSSGTNITVDISDGPNTNALTANQTQIIARAITNIVAGPGINVTGTNVVSIGSSVVTNPWPNNLTVTGTVSVANSTYPDQLFIVNPVNGIVDIGDAGFDVHKTFIFVNDNTRTVAISATNGVTIYGPFNASLQTSQLSGLVPFANLPATFVISNQANANVGGNLTEDDNTIGAPVFLQQEHNAYTNAMIGFAGKLVFDDQAGNPIQIAAGIFTGLSKLTNASGFLLVTNAPAASSSTNLLATDSSGNQVTVPWSGLPSGGGAANGLYTNVTSGIITSAVNFTNVANSFTGNGSGLFGLNATSIVGLSTNGLVFVPVQYVVGTLYTNTLSNNIVVTGVQASPTTALSAGQTSLNFKNGASSYTIFNEVTVGLIGSASGGMTNGMASQTVGPGVTYGWTDTSAGAGNSCSLATTGAGYFYVNQLVANGSQNAVVTNGTTQIVSTALQLTNAANVISGNGGGLTNLNASTLIGNLVLNGTITATSITSANISGNGLGITNLQQQVNIAGSGITIVTNINPQTGQQTNTFSSTGGSSPYYQIVQIASVTLDAEPTVKEYNFTGAPFGGGVGRLSELTVPKSGTVTFIIDLYNNNSPVGSPVDLYVGSNGVVTTMKLHYPNPASGDNWQTITGMTWLGGTNTMGLITSNNAATSPSSISFFGYVQVQ